MNDDQKQKKQDAQTNKKKLVIRKQSIRTLDRRELSLVVGGTEPPLIGDNGGSNRP